MTLDYPVRQSNPYESSSPAANPKGEIAGEFFIPPAKTHISSQQLSIIKKGAAADGAAHAVRHKSSSTAKLPAEQSTANAVIVFASGASP